MNISNDKAIYCTVTELREIEQNDKVYFLSHSENGEFEVKEYNYKELKGKSPKDLQNWVKQDNIILDNVYSSKEAAEASKEKMIMDDRSKKENDSEPRYYNQYFKLDGNDIKLDNFRDDYVGGIGFAQNGYLANDTVFEKGTGYIKSTIFYTYGLTDDKIKQIKQEKIETLDTQFVNFMNISNDKAIYCTVAELREIEQNNKVYFLSYTNEGDLEVKEYNYTELKQKSSEDLQRLIEQDHIILDNAYSSKDAAEASKETIITNNRSEEENSGKPRDYNQYFKLDGNDIKTTCLRDWYGGISFKENGYLANDTVFEKGVAYIEDSVYGLTDYEIKQIKQEKIETLDTQFVNFMNISNYRAIYCTVAELREIEQNDKVYFLSRSYKGDFEVKEYNYKELKGKSSKDLRKLIERDNIILDNVYSSREAAEASKETMNTNDRNKEGNSNTARINNGSGVRSYYNQYLKLDGNNIETTVLRDWYGGISFKDNGYLANDTVFEKGVAYIEDSIFDAYGLTYTEVEQIKKQKINTLNKQFVNFMNISNDQAIYCTVTELKEIEENKKVYFLSRSDNEELEVKKYNYKKLKGKSSEDLRKLIERDNIILDNVYSSREAAEVSKEKQKTDNILNLLKLKTQYEHKLTKYNKKLDNYIKKENIDIKVNTDTDIEDEIFNKYLNKVLYYSSKLNELDEKLDPILHVDNKTKDKKQEKFFNADKKSKEKKEEELYYFKLIEEDGKYYYQVMQYDKNTEDFDKSRESVIHVRIDVRNQYKTLFTEKETKIYSKQLDKYCTQKDDKFVICKDDGEIKNLREYINPIFFKYYIKPKKLEKHSDSVNFEQDTDNVVNEESNEQLLNKSEQDKTRMKLQDMFPGVKSCEKGDCYVYGTIKKNSQLSK